MRLYRCDVCGKILMIFAGERTVDPIFGLDLCPDCAAVALDIYLLDEYIHKIIQAREEQDK